MRNVIKFSIYGFEEEMFICHCGQEIVVEDLKIRAQYQWSERDPRGMVKIDYEEEIKEGEINSRFWKVIK